MEACEGYRAENKKMTGQRWGGDVPITRPHTSRPWDRTANTVPSCIERQRWPKHGIVLLMQTYAGLFCYVLARVVARSVRQDNAQAGGLVDWRYRFAVVRSSGFSGK